MEADDVLLLSSQCITLYIPKIYKTCINKRIISLVNKFKVRDNNCDMVHKGVSDLYIYKNGCGKRGLL